MATRSPRVRVARLASKQRELEAEAIAYVVGSYFGIQSPSDFYLAMYEVTPAMLLEAVETIAKTVKTILEGCPQQEPQPASESISMPVLPAISDAEVLHV